MAQEFLPGGGTKRVGYEKKDFQYLYQEGDDYIFMYSETYDQAPLPKALLGDQMKYLRENDIVKLTMYEGKPLDVELPATVEHKVVETEPSMKGATAQAQYKPAITESGLRVTVPPFIGVDFARDSRWGATVGAGVEYAFAPNWSVGFEYDHLFMGNRDVVSPTGFLIVDHINEDVDLFTVRVNYKFGGPWAPIY